MPPRLATSAGDTEMATTTTPTRVRPGLDFNHDYAFTMFPAVVHLQQPGRIDKTRCGKPVRYYPRAGDQRSWPLCHECEQSAKAEETERAS
jgi:hypothetical protein